MIQEKLDELESYLHELEILLPEHEKDCVELRTKRAYEKTFGLTCDDMSFRLTIPQQIRTISCVFQLQSAASILQSFHG